jgi:hypothetical protein
MSEKDGMVARRMVRPEDEFLPTVTAGQWEDGVRETVGAITDRGIRTLLISDTPRSHRDVPTCLSRAVAGSWANGDCAIRRDEALNLEARRAQAAALRGMTLARIAEFSDLLCDAEWCKVRFGNAIVYRDGNHLTTNVAQAFAPVLGLEIDALLQGN